MLQNSEKGRGIIGIAHLSILVSKNRGGLGIVVLPQSSGIGIGSSLLKAIIQVGKNHGLEKIHLDVDVDNIQAIKLYEKYGFIMTEIVKSKSNLFSPARVFQKMEFTYSRFLK